MTNRLFILLIGIAFVANGKAFSQTISEIKSNTTLQMMIVGVRDISKNRLSANIDIYVSKEKLKSYKSNNKGKCEFNLFLKNEYKMVVYKTGYDSCIMFVDTRMSNETEKNDAKYGFSMPFEIFLKKHGEESKFINPGRIYYNEKSGFFEFDRKSNQLDFTPPIDYDEYVLEHKSKITCDLIVELKEKESNKEISNGSVHLYSNNKRVREIEISNKKYNKFGLSLSDNKVQLYLQNIYKIVVSSDGYKSKVFVVDTRASESAIAEAKFGWEMPMKLSLVKGQDENTHSQPLFRITLNPKTGYFDYDVSSNNVEKEKKRKKKKNEN